MPYLSASAVMIQYEEALYQVYGPVTLPLTTAFALLVKACLALTLLVLALADLDVFEM